MVDRIRRGHLDVRIEGKMHGELDSLKNGINSMAVSLSEYHVEMQHSIDQATSDLRETLEQLEIQNVELDIAKKRAQEAARVKSEFLANMSHELRTPLTRLKLQLAMISQKDLSINMSKDIDEMEKMLNDYLQFAKTQSQENSTNINLKNFFEEITKSIGKEKLQLECKQDIFLKGRPMALKRSFENIIQNGLIYGKNVFVEVRKGNNRAQIIIEDDGPGIPEDQYKNVFKPFFRLDKSRSLNQSGVGLGLSIVEDVINSHGGSIQLGKSKLSGLKVKISLPF